MPARRRHSGGEQEHGGTRTDDDVVEVRRRDVGKVALPDETRELDGGRLVDWPDVALDQLVHAGPSVLHSWVLIR